MKYEAPELTALTPAISAIQNSNVNKVNSSREDADLIHDLVPSYDDWE